jgi:hypothetical protein
MSDHQSNLLSGNYSSRRIVGQYSSQDALNNSNERRYKILYSARELLHIQEVVLT